MCSKKNATRDLFILYFFYFIFIFHSFFVTVLLNSLGIIIIINMKLEDIELPVGLRTKLLNEGYETVDELKKASLVDLSKGT
jgi:hypothetical protein